MQMTPGRNFIFGPLLSCREVTKSAPGGNANIHYEREASDGLPEDQFADSVAALELRQEVSEDQETLQRILHAWVRMTALWKTTLP
jgi:hypothetical protein